TVNIAVVLGALLLLGTAETFADLGSQSLLPLLVPTDALGLANARLQSAHLLVNELIGPPIGAFLFVVGMALPFATDAICFLFCAILVSQISSSTEPAPTEGAGGGSAGTGTTCSGLGASAVDLR